MSCELLHTGGLAISQIPGLFFLFVTLLVCSIAFLRDWFPLLYRTRSLQSILNPKPFSLREKNRFYCSNSMWLGDPCFHYTYPAAAASVYFASWEWLIFTGVWAFWPTEKVKCTWPCTQTFVRAQGGFIEMYNRKDPLPSLVQLWEWKSFIQREVSPIQEV